jgi:DNA-binding NtrC family response regulator
MSKTHSSGITVEQTHSEMMHDALVKLERVAQSDLSVILHGEPGLGKEWPARQIHELSSRSEGPFHPIECAALGPESIEKELFGYETITWNGIDIQRGAFEEASGGTLFLHEFTTVPLPVQFKLARVVEYKHFRRIGGENKLEVNVRLIVTTTKAPNPIPQSGSNTDEFATRVAAITIELPPLRERKSDIPFLIDKFILEIRKRYGSTVQGISKGALERCLAYEWPGNVRHLKNAVEYASIMSNGTTILPEHLPVYLNPSGK